MSYIICILGKSRAGKDTLASFLTGSKIKFAGIAKRTFEQWYGLNKGDLERSEVRNAQVPDLDGVTYLDIMVRAYHAWRAIDPYLTIRPTIKQIQAELGADKPVIITDVRSPEELTSLLKLPCPLFAVYIRRDGCPEVTSDEHLEANWQRLVSEADEVFSIVNSGNLDILKAKARKIEAYIKASL